MTAASSSLLSSSAAAVGVAAKADSSPAFRVGEYVPPPLVAGNAEPTSEDPTLLPHLDKSWLREWLEEREPVVGGAPAEEAKTAPSGAALIEDWSLRRHALVCGSSGYGKSRFTVMLLMKQLEAGCSVAVIDPKGETVEHMLSEASRIGFPADRVTLVSPVMGGRPVPWNPLDGDALSVDYALAAKDLVTVIRDTTPSWGPQMNDILNNALLLACGQRLTLWEAVRALRRPDYREALLQRDTLPGTVQAHAWEELREYFQDEFPALGKGAAGPVINKVREALRSDFLSAMLCSRRPAFDVSSLWTGPPRLLLVHLDFPVLGNDGALLLGGMVVNQLFRNAMRVGGKGGNPVALFLEELGECEPFLGRGSAISQTLAMARSRDLRIIAACQFLDQLSDRLRSGMLNTTSVQMFFNLGREDARLAAESVGAGSGGAVRRLEIAAEKGAASLTAVRTVVDASGASIALTADGWAVLESYAKKPGEERLRALENLAAVSPGVAGPTSAARIVAGLPDTDWSFLGPEPPLRVLLRFPKPGGGAGTRGRRNTSPERYEKEPRASEVT